MFRKIGCPGLCIVENMSYFLCPDNGKRYDIFGHGGAKREAERMGVDFLMKSPSKSKSVKILTRAHPSPSLSPTARARPITARSRTAFGLRSKKPKAAVNQHPKSSSSNQSMNRPHHHAVFSAIALVMILLASAGSPAMADTVVALPTSECREVRATLENMCRLRPAFVNWI